MSLSLPVFSQNGGKLLIGRAHVWLSPQTYGGDSTSYTYDANQLVNREQNWFYHPNNNTWDLVDQAINQNYDTNGHLTSVVYQSGNDMIGWLNNQRRQNTYDGAGHLILSQWDFWQEDMLDWAFLTSTTWEYDAEGKLLSSTGSDVRLLYEYDNDGRLISILTQNLADNIWIDTNKEDFDYLSNDTKIASSTKFYWDGNTWIFNHKLVYTYDGNGNTIEEARYSLIDSVLQNLSRTIYTYDGLGNNTAEVLERRENGIWKTTYKKLSEFDSNSNLLIENEYGYVGIWEFSSYTHYYYAESTATECPEKINFSFFPNPATNQVTLQGENLRQVKILDLQGRVVRQQSLQGQETESLVLGLLPAGNYLIQVTTQEGKTGLKPLQISH